MAFFGLFFGTETIFYLETKLSTMVYLLLLKCSCYARLPVIFCRKMQFLAKIQIFSFKIHYYAKRNKSKHSGMLDFNVQHQLCPFTLHFSPELSVLTTFISDYAKQNSLRIQVRL